MSYGEIWQTVLGGVCAVVILGLISTFVLVCIDIGKAVHKINTRYPTEFHADTIGIDGDITITGDLGIQNATVEFRQKK